MEVLMRMPPTPSRAVVVFAAATFAAAAAAPTPAEAFILPLLFGATSTLFAQPGRGPTDTRDSTVKSGKVSTGTRSRNDDGKPSKASTGTKSRDDDDKPSSASAGKTRSLATKAEGNADSGRHATQTPRRSTVKHEFAGGKSGGGASRVSSTSTSPTGGNHTGSGASTAAQAARPTGIGASTAAQAARPTGSGASTAAQAASPTGVGANIGAQGASLGGSNIGDIFDETLGEVFKARIEELLNLPLKLLGGEAVGTRGP
jgi:hypothetical protein